MNFIKQIIVLIFLFYLPISTMIYPLDAGKLYLYDKVFDVKSKEYLEEYVPTGSHIMKFSRQLLYCNLGASESYIFDTISKNQKKIAVWGDWYFPKKKWIAINNKAFDINTNKWINIIPIENLRIGNEKSLFLEISYSYTEPSVYYINKGYKLIERDIETFEEKNIFVFPESMFKDSERLNVRPSGKYMNLDLSNPIVTASSTIFLGPISPDKKYFPFIHNQNLYIINLQSKKIQYIAGLQLGGLFGTRIDGTMFWDQSSKYLVFGGNSDWIKWIYDSYVFYYSVDDKSIDKIETGTRDNWGFWYSWE
jgi:hypothetical protein